ncbi:MAG: hypothetical protein RL037_1451 [Bacteroidota bacterium]
MRLAILIMAHRLPQQVAILCNLLLNKNVDVYVHIDKKAELEEFKKEVNNPGVTFIQNRVNTKWGEFSIVETIINSYDEILNKSAYDYICNLSGQDLPIKRIEDLLSHLEIHNGKEFIENIPYINKLGWWKENKIRVEKYSFINLNLIGKYKLERLINAIKPRRKPPHNVTFSGNSGWFCLSQDAIKFILLSYKTNKLLRNFFRYVWGADEIYFSTILFNSPFREKMVGNLVHTVWEKEGAHHPKVLTMNDINDLSSSNKFFARKFDVMVDQKIILQLQKELS